MSRIPDCRTDEHYNQKFLRQRDSDYVAGFDWCVEMATDNFFDNIAMDDEIGENTYLGHFLFEELPESLRCEYGFISHDGTLENRKCETYADLIRAKLSDWIEGCRDELITSMIDSMDDAEYRQIKEEQENG